MTRYRGPIAAFEDRWAGLVTPADGAELTIQPTLFDCPSRDVARPDSATASEWVPATKIHRRETVPGLWRAYDRVRPTPATLEADTEYGSGYISIRAMAVVRDTAGALGAEGVGTEAAWDELTAVAEDGRLAPPNVAGVIDRGSTEPPRAGRRAQRSNPPAANGGV